MKYTQIWYKYVKVIQSIIAVVKKKEQNVVEEKCTEVLFDVQPNINAL